MKIELAHDALAAKVYDKVSLEEKTLRRVEKFIQDRHNFYLSRDALLTRDDLDYIRPYLGQVDISEDQRRFVNKSRAAIQRRRRILAAIVAAVFLAISSLAVYSLIQRGRAETQRELAVANAEEAKKQAQIAEENAAEAERQANIAREKAEEARRNLEKAVEEEKRANIQARIAQQKAREEAEARKAADEAKRVADIARQNALDAQNAEKEQREAAEKAKEIAEQKEREARELLILSIAQSMAAQSLQLEDTNLRTRIAQQAYKFNTENGGNPYDRTIYEGLYYALKKEEGDQFNQLNGHKSAVHSMVFAKFGKQLFTTGSDGKLLLWTWNDAIVKGTQKPVEINRLVKRTLAISPNGRWIVAGWDRPPYLKMYNLTEPEQEPTLLNGHQAAILDLDFMPDGSGFVSLGKDRNVMFYDLKANEFRKITQTEVPLREITISPDGKQIAGINTNGMILFWDHNGEPDTSPELLEGGVGQEYYSLCYNTEGDRLAAGDKNGIVTVWNLDTKQKFPSLRGHNARVSDVKFSYNDKYLATASYDGTVQLWVVGDNEDYSTRLPIVMRDHDSWVMSLAFSPDSENLLTGGRDGQIKLWPTQPENLAADMCERLDKNLTSREWTLFVGDEIPRSKACENLPLPD